jgi:hypothetical protein
LGSGLRLAVDELDCPPLIPDWSQMNRGFHRAYGALAFAIALAGCGRDGIGPDAEARRTPVAAPDPKSLVHADVIDGQGLAWRSLTETVGLSWNQVAALCPRDGVNPCWGSINGVNLSGYVWATEAQLLQKLATFDPAILTTPTLVGNQYGPAVTAFFNTFGVSGVAGRTRAPLERLRPGGAPPLTVRGQRYSPPP